MVQRTEEALYLFRALARLAEDLPLFSAKTSQPEAPPPPAVVALGDVNPDELTSRAALDLVYRLKGML